MNKNLEILKKRVSKYRNKKFLILCLKEFLNAVNISAVFFFLVIIIELILRSDSEIRKFEFYISLFLFVILCLVKILPLFVSYFNEKDLAKSAGEIGKSDSSIKDELQNIIELDNISSSEESRELVDAAIDKLYKKIENVDFSGMFSLKQFRKILFSFFVIVILFSSIQFITPLRKSFKSILFYNTEVFTREIAVWEVTPGSKNILKNENIKLNVKLSGISTNQISLFYKNDLQSEWISRKIVSDSTQIFTGILKNLIYNTDYYFTTGSFKSNIYRLSVVDFPEIKTMDLEITPPAYSKQTALFQSDNGNITALKGSKVKFKIRTTKYLSEAKLKLTKDSIDLNIEKNIATGELVVKNNTVYFIKLKDTLGFENYKPIEYTINSVVDKFPEIELIRPGKDLKLGAENSVQFEIKLQDDFGFRRLDLNYRLSKSLYEEPGKENKKLRLSISSNELEQTKYFLWNLDTLNLAAGDEVSYFFSLSDNDYVSGPKISNSKTFKIIVPSIEEILSESDNVYSDSFDKLEDVLTEAEELKKEFSQLQNDLRKKDPNLKFNEKEEIKETLDKYEELIEKAKDAGKNLNELKEKLSENNLLSEETLNKYQELQNLFKEIGSEELKKAFEDMNKLLDQMNRKNAQNKLEQIKFDEEQFQKSIERTINLLKQLQVEQKIENLKNRIDNIAKAQKELLENEKEYSRKKQSQKQKSISDQLKSMEKESAELTDLMKELKNMPAKEMEEFSKELARQKNVETSEDAQKNLTEGNNDKAKKSQQQIEKNMASLQSSMTQIQETMQKENQMEIFYGLMRIFNGIIELSEFQENLLLKTKAAKNQSPGFSDLAKKGNKASNNLANLFMQANKLGQKTFLITPELGKTFGDARRNITLTQNNLSEGKKYQAEKTGEAAVSALNKSALIVKKMIDMLLSDDGSSGSQGGMSMMQQLKKMGSQQMTLNQMTQKMMQGKKLSMQQKGQMERLAQQQELIRGSLAELNKENKEKGKSKTLTQNLDKILDEMQEVIKKMKTGDSDFELKKQQDKILSKLLDAQKSISERDFEEKRESVEGQEIKRLSPAEINKLENISDELKEELIKSLKEGYSKDYEDLIRRYFEKLQKEKNRK